MIFLRKKKKDISKNSNMSQKQQNNTKRLLFVQQENFVLMQAFTFTERKTPELLPLLYKIKIFYYQ